MRSILLDEFLEPEIAAINYYLHQNTQFSGLEGLYWIPLPEELWEEPQRKAPKDEGSLGLEGSNYRFAVEIGDEWVRFELLIRSEGLLNLGGGMASEAQTLFILRWIDEMIKKLNLSSPSSPSDKTETPTKEQ